MLYYQSYPNKDKETLVLLHSGGMAGIEWQPQIASFSQLFHLLVPDLPGHGQSLLPENKPLTISLMANAVIEMLEKEGCHKAHIVGSSMGGAVALWLAINHPEIVDKLVIYRMGYAKNSETHAQTTAMSNPDYWRQYGLHKWMSETHLPQGGVDAWETVIANVSKVLDPKTSEHNHSLDDLQKITASTLLISGDRDPLIPVETLLSMYETIPDASLWIMPNASHVTGTNTWRAKAFFEEVHRFLR